MCAFLFWINMQDGSFDLLDLQLGFCIYNKLHLHAEILSYRVIDITYP